MSWKKRQWVKPARKWGTPTSHVCKEEKQSKLDTAGHVQARTMKGVFMFGSTARIVAETKSSLLSLQELPSHQENVGNQVKTKKKPGHWSRFAKFLIHNICMRIALFCSVLEMKIENR